LLSKMLFAVERFSWTPINANRSICTGKPESRLDLCAPEECSRILDVADLRQYIYEMMGRIRTTALSMSDLCGNDNGHGQGKSNGHGYRCADPVTPVAESITDVVNTR